MRSYRAEEERRLDLGRVLVLVLGRLGTIERSYRAEEERCLGLGLGLVLGRLGNNRVEVVLSRCVGSLCTSDTQTQEEVTAARGDRVFTSGQEQRRGRSPSF